MNFRQILSVLILMLGLIAAILPEKKKEPEKWTEKELVTALLKDTYFVSADELAHLLISGDPSIQLIDIRAIDATDTLLSGAINVPADSVLHENFEFIFDQDVRKNILYGDDNEQTRKTWMSLKSKGYTNIYMLRGGLKSWKTDILNPEHPGQSATQDELNLYAHRSAARMYFTGAKALPKTKFKIVLPQGRKKKKRVEGGCS